MATGLAVVLTSGAVLGVGALSERNARRTLEQEIEARLVLQAKSVAASSTSALLGDYPELTLHPLIKKMRAVESELELVVVVDHDNQVQGHADARFLGRAFEPPPGLAGSGPAIDPLSPDTFLRRAAGLLIARAPVLHPNGRVIGSAYVGLPLRHVDALLESNRRQQALLLGLLVFLGAAAAFMLMSRLLHPIAALRAGLERIGQGDLDTPLRLGGRTEIGRLAETVNDMAAALKHAQNEMLERERLSHEMDLAREIQRSLLPSRSEAAGPFDIRGDQRAAAEVGGDYWDILPLPDGKVAIAVADVAGKGLAGCLVMSMLSALLRALRTSHTSPAALLAALDERLSETLLPGAFVTMCYGVLDPATGQLTYASAGHNPLVVWRRATGEVEIRSSKGIPIGAVRGGAIRATLRDETLQLGPGDVCVQFTDGFTEAFRGGRGEAFGMDRLREAVQRNAPQGGEAVLRSLWTSLRAWSGDAAPADDETLLVVTCDRAAPAFPCEGRVETTDEVGLRTALDRLAQAERFGSGVGIPARLDRLTVLDGWLHDLPDLAALSAERLELTRAALYEACANIVEHGCGEDAVARLDVWWLPAASAAGAAGAACATAEANGGGEMQGLFVIRDSGRPYRPFGLRPNDFRDPAVRSRGRGLGLEIIHRAVMKVTYEPATTRGNITVLAIGPPTPRSNTEEIAA